MVEFHRVRRASLGHRTQRRGVAKHLGQRHIGADNLASVLLCHSLHHAAAGREIAHDVPGVLFRRFHLHVHDRLKDHRIRPASALLEAEDRRHAERHLRGVDVVIRAKRQRRLNIDDRIARQHAAVHRFPQPFLHGRDILARHHAALGGIFKYKATSGLQRLQAQDHMTVLPFPAGLPDKFTFNILHRLAQGFPVGYLRTTNVRLDAKLTLHAVDDNLQV